MPPPSPRPSPCHSVDGVCVQPAAKQLGHIQRQGHEVHVSGALRRVPPGQRPSAAGSLPAHCLRRRHSPHALPPPPGPTCRPALPRPRLATWQYARAFNQSLSFDTSSVTSMRSMFQVRSAQCPPRQRPSAAGSLTARCLRRRHSPPDALPPPPTLLAAPLSPSPPLATRQEADAFNQPLNLDTSSVKDLEEMFYVRSARARPRQRPSAAGSLPAHCFRLPRLPPRPPACPRGPACRPLSPRPPLATRQLVDAFNQPLSFDTSSVTSMRVMFYVRSARAPPGQRPSAAGSLPAHWACTAATPPANPSRQRHSACTLAPPAAPSLHALPLPLGRARRRSTSS